MHPQQSPAIRFQRTALSRELRAVFAIALSGGAFAAPAHAEEQA